MANIDIGTKIYGWDKGRMRLLGAVQSIEGDSVRIYKENLPYKATDYTESLSALQGWIANGLCKAKG